MGAVSYTHLDVYKRQDHGRTGCVIKDSALYGPMFKKYNAEAVVLSLIHI